MLKGFLLQYHPMLPHRKFFGILRLLQLWGLFDGIVLIFVVWSLFFQIGKNRVDRQAADPAAGKMSFCRRRSSRELFKLCGWLLAISC
jgi:hypothetical protein